MVTLEELMEQTLTSMKKSTASKKLCKAPGCTDECAKELKNGVRYHPYDDSKNEYVYLDYCRLHYEQLTRTWYKSEHYVPYEDSVTEELIAAKKRHFEDVKKLWLLQKPGLFQEKIKATGLESIEAKARFGNFTQTAKNKQAFQSSQAFAIDKQERGVFLISPPGNGKTHLAAATIKVVIARGKTAKFYKVTDLLGRLRSTFKDNSEETEQQVIDELADYEVLFLDDFGVERPTEYVCDVLYRIIDIRYRRELPIFATSNLSLSELAERTDDRITSRLAAMCEVVKFQDKDWRLKR